MRCTVVLEFDGEPGESPRRVDLLRLHRDVGNPSACDIGLTLTEANRRVLWPWMQPSHPF